MSEPASEGKLIEACREGDREAFRQLFEAYQNRVWSIALHFTGDEALARDITQQVFLKIFTSIGQFRHEARFTTWLYRLVVNVCLDEQRRRRRFISFDFFGVGERDQEIASDVKTMVLKQTQEGRAGVWNSTLDDRGRQMEICAAVKGAVRELRPKLRMAILLKHFEELSYEEMAQVLGCSIGTVASRLNRGHKELARKLAHLRR